MTPEQRAKIEQDPGTVKVLHSIYGELHDGFAEGCPVCAKGGSEEYRRQIARQAREVDKKQYICSVCKEPCSPYKKHRGQMCNSCSTSLFNALRAKYVQTNPPTVECTICGQRLHRPKRLKTTLCLQCYHTQLQASLDEVFHV